MRGPRRERQPQREQRARHQFAAQLHHDVPEVDLGLLTTTVRLRDEHLHRGTAGFGQDLPAAHRHMRTHPRIRHVDLVLLTQPIEDPLGGVTLFAWRGQIPAKPAVDDPAVIVDLAAAVGVMLAFGRPR